MRIRYSDIHSIEELDRAIESNSDAIRHKGRVLSRRYSRIKDYYSPSALAVEGLKRFMGLLPLPEFILRRIGRAIRRK